MKKLIAILLFSITSVQAQELIIDLDKDILNQEILIESNVYQLRILGSPSIVVKEILMKKDVVEYEWISRVN